MTDSIWEYPDGTWTTASYALREFFFADGVMPAEIYYVLHSLGILDRFRDHWDNDLFFKSAGLFKHAGKSIDTKRDGQIALAGDYAWAAGDIGEAKRLYEESLRLGRRDSSAMAGLGGLVRLHFVFEQYEECVNAFRMGCPPHEYYVQRHAIESHGITDQWMKAHADLDKRFRKTSSCFLSGAKYMCRAIIAASVKAGGIDENLRIMISDYFDIEPSEVDEVAESVATEKELVRLRKRVAPKPATNDHKLDDLLVEGKTERAMTWCDRLPNTDSCVDAAASCLDEYLESGHSSLVDEVIVAGSPFGVSEADGVVLSAALESREAIISTVPARRLVLLRRFNALCRYPKYDFLNDYLEVMGSISADIESGDILAAILDLQWYKTLYTIDMNVPGVSSGGLGKAEIDKHREWLEIVLRDYPPAFDREWLSDRDTAVAALHRAYLFLRERFVIIRQDERWVSEAQLGDALVTLFGKSEVVRHARPLWLSPQHLDYFLPRYNLAVEYMGAQHYQAIEIFGGKRALEETRKRDERKRSLCELMGVSLVYVTHEEDIGRRAIEIHSQFNERRI